jgi:hypothetical protein
MYFDLCKGDCTLQFGQWERKVTVRKMKEHLHSQHFIFPET